MRFVVGRHRHLPLGVVHGPLRRLSRSSVGEWRPLAVLGLLFSVQMAATNIGTWLTSAAHATILLNLYAVHTVVLAHFLIPGDRLTVRKLGGVLVAYSGIVAALRQSMEPRGADAPGRRDRDRRRRSSSPSAPCLSRAGRPAAGPGEAAAGAGDGGDRVLRRSPRSSSSRRPPAGPPRLAGSIAYQGVLISGFNFVVNLALLRDYRPSALSAFFLTQPIFGVIAAALVAGDPLTPVLAARLRRRRGGHRAHAYPADRRACGIIAACPPRRRRRSRSCRTRTRIATTRSR